MSGQERHWTSDTKTIFQGVGYAGGLQEERCEVRDGPHQIRVGKSRDAEGPRRQRHLDQRGCALGQSSQQSRPFPSWWEATCSSTECTRFSWGGTSGRESDLGVSWSRWWG